MRRNVLHDRGWLGSYSLVTAGSKSDQICRLLGGSDIGVTPLTFTRHRLQNNKKIFFIHNQCRHYLTHYLRAHYTINHLEERGVERGSARPSSLGNVRETSERRGGAHMGFSERIDTILN